MTKHKSTKRVPIAALICIAVSFLVVSGKSSRSLQPPAKQNPTNYEVLRLREALNRGGLREAAKLKGHYVGEYDPHWDLGPFTVEALTKNSPIVIAGRITKKLQARIPDSRVIFTDYEVAVDELIKGDLNSATTIVVTVAGGRMDFEDGTSAEQSTPNFEQPRIGHAYVLFLMREKAVPSVFFLFAGPEGMFDIEDSSNVKSHGRPDDAAAVETKGKSRESFLEDVRQQARMWPQPGTERP